MYLKRVTLNGFKSFAGRTVLELEPGMTAVVGPNGSGKSNIAEAVRWALGEQRKAALRTRDREEVIFAGSSKRPRASLAEVALVFDNTDGSWPLEQSEVEVSRRLYRSGESEYRLAGQPVRLGDLQVTLATAGLATGYTVIGQNMIDNLLLAGPTERKLLFSEASGIRADELRREEARRKLNATEANLERLRGLVRELEPRLAHLEHLARAAEEFTIAKNQLVIARQRLTGLGRERTTTRLHELETELSQLEQARQEETAAVKQLESELAVLAEAEMGREAEYDRLLGEMRELGTRRDTALQRVAALDALYTAAPPSTSGRSGHQQRLERELGAARERYNDAQSNLQTTRGALKRAVAQVERLGTAVSMAQERLMVVRGEARESLPHQYVSGALSLVRALADNLAHSEPDQEQLRLLVHKTGRLLNLALKGEGQRLAGELEAAQRALEAAMLKRETAMEHQANLTITLRSQELESASEEAEVTRLEHELGRNRELVEAAQVHGTHLAVAQRELSELEESLQARRNAVREAQARGNGASELKTRLSQRRLLVADLQRRHEEHIQHRRETANEHDRYQQLAQEWGTLDYREPDTVKESLQELQAAVWRLEARVGALGETADGNQDEYLATQQRHSELVAQIADLESAQADLQRAAGELDAAIKARFHQGFETLATAFSRQFERLVGGKAALELRENEEAGEYGIYLTAQPKGKRLTNLEALSGGERALTGVALLSAILEANPGPCVILDEVDAALDEANSGRLAELLEELASRTQLIVVTHNRQTMSAARALYGVALSDTHASNLLSVRLEEAQELAAR